MPAAIDEGADLSPYLVREFGELARKLGCQYLVRVNPPGVELFDAANLIRLEARGVSDYILDGSCPPVIRLTKARAASSKPFDCSAIGIGLKLQEE